MAPSTDQIKYRTHTTGVGALRSLDPTFFYKVRKVPEDGESQAEEAEQKKQSDTCASFNEWLKSNSEAYDVSEIRDCFVFLDTCIGLFTYYL